MSEFFSVYHKCFKLIVGKKYLFINIIVKISLLALNCVRPYMLSQMIGCLANRDRFNTYRYTLYIVIILLSIIICRTLAFFSYQHIEKSTTALIKKDLLKRVLLFHPASAINNCSAKITETIYSDSSSIVQIVIQAISLGSDLISVLITGYIVFSIGIVNALFAFLFTILTFLLANKYARILMKMNSSIRTLSDKNFKILRDIILLEKVIKFGDSANYFLRKYSNEIDYIKLETIERDKVSWKANTIGTLLEDLSIIIFLLISIYMFFDNQTTLTSFIAFFSYTNIFSASLTRVFKFNTDIQEIVVASTRVLELYCATEEPLQGRNKHNELKKIDEIQLQDISFSYESNCIFSNFSYQFKKGHCYLIVGANGSGKTTLLNLIAGLLQPQNGELKYDGNSHKEIAYKNLQKNIAYYSQDDKVHKISILDNLLLFENNSNISRAAVNSICMELNLWEFIQSLPNGLETIISEENDLSYGQKRKIILAKNILKPSQILLLDEPLSGIDQASQANIINVVKQLSKDKIIIIATHRADLFSFAQSIIML